MPSRNVVHERQRAGSRPAILRAATRSTVLLLAVALCVSVASDGAAVAQARGPDPAPLPIVAGDAWAYAPGSVEPVAGWNLPGFDDSSWASGPSGFGYGDGDDATELGDMRNGYVSVYTRKVFTVPDPSRVTSLGLEVDWDDGFVAFLNGQEVARRNLAGASGTPVPHGAVASNHEAGTPETIALSPTLLVAGANVIAVQGHNVSLNSTDFSLIVELRAQVPPAAPSDPAPAAGATGVSTDPELCVTVSDPGDPALVVSFYGRDLAGSSPAFTVITLPDAQFYSQSYPATFIAQTRWIVENRALRNIVFVTSVGDSVNTCTDAQWANADAAWDLLEDPATTGLADGIPYGLAVGNHDQSPNGDPGTLAKPGATTTLYNRYFGLSRFEGRSYHGGHYGNEFDNHYELFDASGMAFLALHFEYMPTDSPLRQDVLAWADGVLKAHPERRVLLTSHFFLDPLTSAWSDQGRATWDALKDNHNLFLMLSGHEDQAYRLSAEHADAGGTTRVNAMVSDYQTRPNGGNGWLRILTFEPDEDTIDVETYSPTLGVYIDGHADNTAGVDANRFTVPYDMDGAPAFGLAGTSPGSGARVCVPWPGRAQTTAYEWYAVVSDGTSSSTGERWRFTTRDDVPEILSRAPAPGARRTDPDTTVVVVFSEPMDPATLTPTSFRLRAAGAPTDVPATVNTAGSTAVLTPQAPLAPSTTYTVTVAAEAADLAGNALGADDSWTFATAGASVCRTDTTAADFSAGDTTSGLHVGLVEDGEVLIAPMLVEEFTAPGAASQISDHAIVVSVDGMGAQYVEPLLAPGLTNELTTIKRILAQGSGTLNARTDPEYAVTLPNHIDMLTGRGVSGSSGHGWSTNGWPDGSFTTLAQKKGAYVASAFDVAHDHGLRTGIWAAKGKFGLFQSSYGATAGADDLVGEDNGKDKIDYDRVQDGATATTLTDDFLAQMAAAPFHFAFVHFPDLDATGHSSGWSTDPDSAFAAKLKALDTQIGRILEFVECRPELAGNTSLIVTADHGGHGTSHGDIGNPADFTIPFLAWGPGVAAQGDLYDLNPQTRTAPGAAENPAYAGSQPVRNGDAANLALDLLGLSAIPGSMIDSNQDLQTGTNSDTAPEGWNSMAWAAGGSAGIAGGYASVEGARLATDCAYGPGRSLEFVATFATAPQQDAGLAADLLTAPWAVFSTTENGGGLYARTNNGSTSTTVFLGESWCGSPHRYRIDWDAAQVRYLVDGVPLHTEPMSVSQDMRPVASDRLLDGIPIALDWVRLSPYGASGTFVSRVFAADMDAAPWIDLVSSASLPVGTGISFETRSGPTPEPDESWSVFAETSGSEILSPSGRYLQYRATLATDDDTASPELQEVSACYAVCTPIAETCNGVDDDCDEAIDEDLGSTTCGTGACQVTVANCVGGVPQDCVPQEAAEEICNAVDDDCDEFVDEDLGSTTCGTGACQVTVPTAWVGRRRIACRKRRRRRSATPSTTIATSSWTRTSGARPAGPARAR
ncbi:MAG: Ig-like domain-containing protein [Acidobacteria bacterium]|nr:Ig-like domain-containing protein [Acidobacteriota bacterium]